MRVKILRSICYYQYLAKMNIESVSDKNADKTNNHFISMALKSITSANQILDAEIEKINKEN